MFKIDTLGIRRTTLANAFAGRLMSILDEDHATERQKLPAKETQIASNSSVHRIPADRTTDHETDDKRSD